MAAEIWAWQDGSINVDTLNAAAMGRNSSSAVLAGFTSGDWNGTFSGSYTDWAAVKLNTDDGEMLWKWQNGSVGSSDRIYGAAVGEDESVFLAGGGAGGFAVIKLDSAGSEVWRYLGDTEGFDQAYGVVAVADGGCVVAGITGGDWATTFSGGHKDFAAFRLDSEGSVVWRWQSGTPGQDQIFAVTAADDGTGEVVLVGRTSESAIFRGGSDHVAIKLSATGEEIWRYQNRTSASDAIHAAATAADGSIALAGSAWSGYDSDFFVAYLSAGGEWIWSYQNGTDGWDEELTAVVIESEGIVVAGHTDGAVAWGEESAGGLDCAVLKLSFEGEEIWRFQGGTGRDDYCNAMAGDSAGRVILAGETNGSRAQTNLGDTDFLAFVLDTTGDSVSAPAPAPAPASSSRAVTRFSPTLGVALATLCAVVAYPLLEFHSSF